MHMLENIQRRFGVAAAGGCVQHFRHFRLALCAALMLRILRDGVKLH